MEKFVITLLFVCTAFAAIDVNLKTPCKVDSECHSERECCFYHEGPMIASRKRQLFPFNSLQVQGGWCEKYLQNGNYCSSFAKINGHCGCGKGLKCTIIKDPTMHPLTDIVKRGMIFGGHEECRPAN